VADLVPPPNRRNYAAALVARRGWQMATCQAVR